MFYDVYPACAGIDPNAGIPYVRECRLPRMRGDRPLLRSVLLEKEPFTPHARGSTPTRLGGHNPAKVYPACAGIDLVFPGNSVLSLSLPRMRGDRPDE